jgi:protein O-GlcNAc transferase
MPDAATGQERKRLPPWTWALIGIAVAALIIGMVLKTTGHLPALGGNPPVSLVESGRAYLESGDLSSAIADLTAAVSADPEDSQAHFLLGQAYNRNGDLLKAADEFRAVVEIDPDNAAAHHNLGVTYFQLQDPSAAVAEFNAALTVDPDDADTHYQLGATYLVLSLSASADTGPELVADAVNEFERALNLRENMPEALIGMANIRIQEGNYSAAIDMLKLALGQIPNSPEAHYALAEAYARSGQLDSACDTYDKFLKLDPPEAWQSQAQQQMSAVGCE